jgi:serine/threonine protein kinase
MNTPGSRIQTDVGSPAYISPEKIRGEDFGLPSDIWYFIHSSIIINLF